MKVLISAGWMGGAGGAERNLQSMVRALVPRHEVDVVVRKRLDGPLSHFPSGVRVFTSEGFRWYAASLTAGWKGVFAQRVVNPVRRRLLPWYDLYLQLMSGASLGRTVRVGRRVIIPSGNPVPAHLARQFDYVGLQAPGNDDLVPDGARAALLTPPVYDLSDASVAPGVSPPGDFLLTVFNPYGAIKGTDDLVEAIDTLPLPLVWCHSQATVAVEIPQPLAHHPRIMHVEAPSPEELRYLYERCRAYICFSRSEGFGWSIADGLRYSPAVVSRELGVLTLPQAKAPWVHLVGAEWAVDWNVVLAATDDRRPRELAWLGPSAFMARVERLAERGTPSLWDIRALEHLVAEAANEESDEILVSVIVPVYRVEDFLDDCVASLVEQTYPYLEIVLVDDGSPDGSGARCDWWAAHDPRVRVVHQENSGLSQARNAGLEVATGEYVAFVDSDDVVAPTFVQCMVARAITFGADMVGTGMAEFVSGAPPFREDEETEVGSGIDILVSMSQRPTRWGIGGKMFNRRLFTDTGVRFEPGIWYEDLELIPRLMPSVRRAVLGADALYGYRQRETSIMGQSRAALSPDLITVLRRDIEVVRRQLPPQPAKELTTVYVLHAAASLEKLASGPGWKASGAYRGAYRSFVRENWALIMTDPAISVGYRVLVAVSAVSPSAFRVLFRGAAIVKRTVFPRLRRRHDA